MKKYLMVLLAMTAFTLSANAKEYKVSVNLTIYYEYYSTDGRTFQFSEENGSQALTIDVTADDESAAKLKANQQCVGMCRGRDDLGIKTKDGVQYKVYRIKHATTGHVWES